MRITARTVPSANPTTIPSTVSCSVSATDRRIDGANRNCPTVGQSHAGFVTSALIAIARSTATTAVAAHRHGCLAGTTVSSSAGSGGADAGGAVTSRETVTRAP